MNRKVKINAKLIDRWILGNWGLSRYTVHQLNREIIKKTYPDMATLEIDEHSSVNFQRTLRYIKDFNNRMRAPNIPIDFVTFFNNDKQVFRCDDPYWMKISSQKNSYKDLDKLKYFSNIKSDIMDLLNVRLGTT